MKFKITFSFIVFISFFISVSRCSYSDGTGNEDYQSGSSEVQSGSGYKSGTQSGSDPETFAGEPIEGPACWLSLKSKELFETIDPIDTEYATTRQKAQQYFDRNDYDKYLLIGLLKDRGIAYREANNIRPNYASIPSGLNLGGLCMLRMPHSVLFFHRMKLRNDTIFRVTRLQHDVENMTLDLDLSLNTLHLTGAYDRSMTDIDPAALIYSPSYGELLVTMTDVKYETQGRYRMLKHRLIIELMVSTIEPLSIELKYAAENDTEPPTTLMKEDMGEFIMRIKTDLDKWLMDYFNGLLLRTDIYTSPCLERLEKYDHLKATYLASYLDDALIELNNKITSLGGNNVILPDFKILASYGLTIEIYNGTLRGLDTMHRRSVATSLLKQQNLRYVDAIIGFSDLKVTYSYKILLPPTPYPKFPLNGLFIMSSSELTAHLSLGLHYDPPMLELDLDFINHMGPDSLIVQGDAHTHIAHIKHLLEHEIATIMSNSVTYGVGLLKKLPRCEPFNPDLVKPKSMDPSLTNVIDF